MWKPGDVEMFRTKCCNCGWESGNLRGVFIEYIHERGVIVEKWRNSPDFVCRGCGKIYGWSSVDTGLPAPVEAEIETGLAAELFRVPVIVR